MAAQPDFHLMARRPAAIDTGLLLRAYAGAAVTVGGFITLWGPMFLATGAADQPFGRAALVRVFGAIVWAAGLTAGGLACIDDPDERRRALAWFTAAHLIVWFFVFVQGYAVWGGGLPTQVSWLLLATTMISRRPIPGNPGPRHLRRQTSSPHGVPLHEHKEPHDQMRRSKPREGSPSLVRIVDARQAACRQTGRRTRSHRTRARAPRGQKAGPPRLSEGTSGPTT